MPIAWGHDQNTADGGDEVRRITPAEFAALDHGRVTLLDLREPADVAANPVEDAVNAPLDPLAHVLRTVPKTRTVVVFCTEGWWSEEVAQILTDRGYEAVSLEGGYRAYRAYLDAARG